MYALSNVCIAVVLGSSGLGRNLAASRRTAMRPELPIKCFAFDVGGGERDRTDDLRLAKPALSQLSYAP